MYTSINVNFPGTTNSASSKASGWGKEAHPQFKLGYFFDFSGKKVLVFNSRVQIIFGVLASLRETSLLIPTADVDKKEVFLAFVSQSETIEEIPGLERHIQQTFFILLTHEGSHRMVYQGFQRSHDLFRKSGVKGCLGHRFRAPPAYTARLLTLHQHRANNQYRTANQI